MSGPVGQRAAAGRDSRGRFPPGHGGRRPRGSRAIGPADFCHDLHADWREHGADCIERLWREDPERYLLIMMAIVLRRWGRTGR
jgi:hypothetical protein